MLAQGYSVFAIANSNKSRQSLVNLIEREGLETEVFRENTVVGSDNAIYVMDGPINQGVVFPSLKIAVLSEEDLTGRRRSKGLRGRDPVAPKTPGGSTSDPMLSMTTMG